MLQRAMEFTDESYEAMWEMTRRILHELSGRRLGSKKCEKQDINPAKSKAEALELVIYGRELLLRGFKLQRNEDSDLMRLLKVIEEKMRQERKKEKKDWTSETTKLTKLRKKSPRTTLVSDDHAQSDKKKQGTYKNHFNPPSPNLIENKRSIVNLDEEEAAPAPKKVCRSIINEKDKVKKQDENELLVFPSPPSSDSGSTCSDLSPQQNPQFQSKKQDEMSSVFPSPPSSDSGSTSSDLSPQQNPQFQLIQRGKGKKSIFKVDEEDAAPATNTKKVCMSSAKSIKTKEERIRYQQKHNQDMPKYMKFFVKLRQVEERGVHLESKLRRYQKGSQKYKKVKEKIYNESVRLQSDAVYQEAKREFWPMHIRMSQVKQMCDEYDSTILYF